MTVSKVCVTMMPHFVTMLCWQYIVMTLWNSSGVQSAAQPPELSDGGDGIEPEGQLLNGPTLNTKSNQGMQDLRKILDGISHRIESPSATGNIFPSDVVGTKPVDTSLMGKRDGLGEIGTKPEEEKESKSEVNKAGNLPDGFDRADENKHWDSKETDSDHESDLTSSATTAIQKPQPMTSTTVHLEESVHSHVEQNQVFKPHPPAMTDGDASSSTQGPEPETKPDRSSAEVIQPSKSEQNNLTKGNEPETNDSTGDESSDHPRGRNAPGEEFSDPPKAIILWSYWRSGSTFLADLLVNTSPNVTFYSFEPLFRYGMRVLTKKHEPETQKAVSFLKDLLKCDLRAHKDYVTENSKHSVMLHANPYLSEHCAKGDKCGDVETFSQRCFSASLHIAKITRLSAQYAKAFLEDPQFQDLQIVYLLRDPRAVMWSRLGSGIRGRRLCDDPTNPIGDQKTDKMCSDPKTVCGLLTNDIKMSRAIWAKNKDRFFALRYEDLSFRPQVTVDILWKPLKLPVTDTFKRYIDQATTGQKPTNQRTDSKRHFQSNALQWRTEAPWDLIHKIQLECSGVIQQLGYKMFESEEELRNMTILASDGKDW